MGTLIKLFLEKHEENLNVVVLTCKVKSRKSVENGSIVVADFILPLQNKNKAKENKRITRADSAESIDEKLKQNDTVNHDQINPSKIDINLPGLNATENAQHFYSNDKGQEDDYKSNFVTVVEPINLPPSPEFREPLSSNPLTSGESSCGDADINPGKTDGVQQILIPLPLPLKEETEYPSGTNNALQLQQVSIPLPLPLPIKDKIDIVKTETNMKLETKIESSENGLKTKKRITFSQPLEFDLMELHKARFVKNEQNREGVEQKLTQISVNCDISNVLKTPPSEPMTNVDDEKMIKIQEMNKMKGMINKVQAYLNEAETGIRYAMKENCVLKEFLEKIDTRFLSLNSKRKLNNNPDEFESKRLKGEVKVPVSILRRREGSHRNVNENLHVHEPGADHDDTVSAIDDNHLEDISESITESAEVSSRKSPYNTRGRTKRDEVLASKVHPTLEKSIKRIKKHKTGPKIKHQSWQQEILKRRLKKTKQRKSHIKLDGECFLCKKADDLLYCDNSECTKGYHANCLQITPTLAHWICPWHRCIKCNSRDTVKKCSQCLEAYCEAHSKGNMFYEPNSTFTCRKHRSDTAVNEYGDSESEKNDHSLSNDDNDNNDGDVVALQKSTQISQNGLLMQTSGYTFSNQPLIFSDRGNDLPFTHTSNSASVVSEASSNLTNDGIITIDCSDESENEDTKRIPIDTKGYHQSRRRRQLIVIEKLPVRQCTREFFSTVA